MPLEDALPILTQIVRHFTTLTAAYRPRDIKPQNVLLNIQDDVLLTDFHLHCLRLSKRQVTSPY